jgi:hypothetical protein
MVRVLSLSVYVQVKLFPQVPEPSAAEAAASWHAAIARSKNFFMS